MRMVKLAPEIGIAATDASAANRVTSLVCLAVVTALAATLAVLRGKRRNHADDETESEETGEEDLEEEERLRDE